MSQSHVQAVLLDIEGTTSSIAFVHDVLFPFARRRLSRFLADHWSDPRVDACREQVARDAGAESFRLWSGEEPGSTAARRHLERAVLRLMDQDAKQTGLKLLQGMIWEEGYESGELRSHVFPDVPPALRSWHSARLDVRIYSSGSAAAQRLFFLHTEAGDLCPLLRGYYDTTVGPKRAAASYAAIAASMNLRPAEVLFLSDVPQELDAARAAGMETRLVVRPGNAPASAGPHEVIEAFDGLFPATAPA